MRWILRYQIDLVVLNGPARPYHSRAAPLIGSRMQPAAL